MAILSVILRGVSLVNGIRKTNGFCKIIRKVQTAQKPFTVISQRGKLASTYVFIFSNLVLRRVHLLSADPSAILIFSGGVTRQDHPIQSEAQSYLKLAIANNLLTNNGDQLQLRSRAFTEDYALDSFQNLLFSIARFHELAVASGIPANSPSAWPTKITVVGFEMKKRRFVELHRRALLFPEDRFEYVGVDFVTPEAKERGWDGEVNTPLPLIISIIDYCHLE